MSINDIDNFFDILEQLKLAFNKIPEKYSTNLDKNLVTFLQTNPKRELKGNSSSSKEKEKSSSKEKKKDKKKPLSLGDGSDNKRRKWTEEQHLIVRDMFTSHKSVEEIATYMGRTVFSIQCVLDELKLTNFGVREKFVSDKAVKAKKHEEHDSVIVSMYNNGTADIEDMSAKIKKPVDFIEKRLRALGIEVSEVISE
jgi:hypothetical protein